MSARLLVVVSANAISMSIMMALLVVVTFYGPDVETSLFPVVKFNPVDPKTIYRNEKITAFALGITKLRAATPVKYEFSIETKLSESIPVAAYLCNAQHRATNEDLNTHPVGAHWIRHYCFETPATVADKQDFRVSGRAIHMRHPFWNTVTPIIPFVVPALKKLSDPD